MKTTDEQVQFQRKYYGEASKVFNTMNIKEADEHYFALAALEGWLDLLGCQSLLDIGAGTGRVVRYFREKKPGMKVMGVEPVAAMREQAYALGVPRTDILEGSGTQLPFPDGAFDIVTETGVLHHIPNPEQAISEMLRVAKKAVLISDCNSMGQGSFLARKTKHVLKSLGLWRVAYWLLHGGKSYWVSEGDGLAYPFSVYDHYPLIRSQCRALHFLNTVDSGVNLQGSAPHVAILGIKN